jgi:mono/diheme cytochrome c family protein
MISVIKNSQIVKFSLSVLVATSIFSSGAVVAESVTGEEEIVGSAEFLISCASCHGASAKGDGEKAKDLNVTPADLTVLAKENDGVYPFLEVFAIIDGRTEASGHGDRSMPVWGDRYSTDIGGPFGGEAAVRAQILDLVSYIKTMQVK